MQGKVCSHHEMKPVRIEVPLNLNKNYEQSMNHISLKARRQTELSCGGDLIYTRLTVGDSITKLL